MKVKDLEFKKIESDNAPEMDCNWCAKNADAKGWNMADIKIAEDAHYSVVLCSDSCLKHFTQHPMAQQYIDENISRMKKMHSRNQ